MILSPYEEQMAAFRLYPASEVVQMEPPRWLVDGVIPEHGEVMFYGAPGDGKSFAGLALAYAVATGSPFCGRPCKQGAVVYVAAEGRAGLVARLQAIAERFGGLPENLYFVFEGPQLGTEPGTTMLLKAVEASCPRPALVIVDTLARCAVGLEENSASEMGKVVASVGRIKRKTGAAVMLVHHRGKGQGSQSPRGSSALTSAVDTQIFVQKVGDRVSLSCEKQKDGEAFEELLMELQRVRLADGGSSAVLVPVASTTPVRARLHTTAHAMLMAFADGAEELDTADLRAAARTDGTPFYNQLTNLKQKGLILAVSKGKNAVTEEGRRYIERYKAGEAQTH